MPTDHFCERCLAPTAPRDTIWVTTGEEDEDGLPLAQSSCRECVRAGERVMHCGDT